MDLNSTVKRPSDIGELKSMIVAAGLRLPEQQERVARIALVRPEMIAFGTISSVAIECHVSPSTVARVATSLGFDSFKEFKACFRQHLRNISASAGYP
ncbi:hypothetical conserved protein [Rhizobium etli CFN 42]|uniref:RpiR family transcriptional regulator protein n=2 Tax=Rhizobium etli TaxID=29449 RepID=A0AAN1EKB3_RHIET|nr:MurR/RpiR family transcriptional regulator [Rhizobium etli]ABC91136.1 hypothetical conserved protein [Rhizobium etli CFN 42]AGS22148.1 RpiR family transcriptional regulator protein [Rhizobium etli bv. mimosae str. Mim1]ARQ10423.1 RpiR family transcriptional regulator protein [Rhizobium etli]